MTTPYKDIKFKILMGKLSVFYRQEVTEADCNLWWEHLQSYPIDDIEKAINDHMHDADEGRWFPNPAHIIAQLEGLSKSQLKIKKEEIDGVWRLVLQRIKHPQNERLRYQMSATSRLALKEIGGIQRLKQLDHYGIEQVKKEFVSVYTELSKLSDVEINNRLPLLNPPKRGSYGGKTAEELAIYEAAFNEEKDK